MRRPRVITRRMMVMVATSALVLWPVHCIRQPVDRLQISDDDFSRALREQRGIARDKFLHEVLYPQVMLHKQEGVGPTMRLETLRRKAQVEVYLEGPRGRERGVEKAPDEAGSREERVRSSERKLGEMSKALEGVRRELWR
jgi:hypothetical protein